MTYDPDQSLAIALRAARAYMEEGDFDDIAGKLETVAGELIALDEWLSDLRRLPDRWT